MVNLSLQTNISIEQLYSLLFQLPAEEKLAISKRLRAEVTAERWRLMSDSLPGLPEISMEEIVAEEKTVRRLRAAHKHNEQ